MIGSAESPALPLFPICVPVYNASLYLREACESIASQTFTNFEVIMVDDDSTDGSGELCDEFTLHMHACQ